MNDAQKKILIGAGVGVACGIVAGNTAGTVQIVFAGLALVGFVFAGVHWISGRVF